MPTFTFDITDEVANVIDSAIKHGGRPDFNPGQAAAWQAVTCDVSGTATVRISGTNVDVNTNISVKCTGAEYISEAVAELEQVGEMLGKSINDGNYFLTQELIDQSFDQL